MARAPVKKTQMCGPRDLGVVFQSLALFWFLWSTLFRLGWVDHQGKPQPSEQAMTEVIGIGSRAVRAQLVFT